MCTVNYLEALKLLEKLTSDTLLSLQHPPTYAVGKRQTVHNLLIPDSELKTIGAELHYTRGSDITFHSPHTILYPIISLRDIGLGARKFVPCGNANKDVTSLKIEVDIELPA
ncbi:Lipoyl ligase [Datura stramonium]|uniref:Lipoyl ligase n=1 Tax=Datura stramonium TaxID=4076 RepID=A0ABS8SX46_DATST|nr:Lipoyl ligase [Datura stramonium]